MDIFWQDKLIGNTNVPAWVDQKVPLETLIAP